MMMGWLADVETTISSRNDDYEIQRETMKLYNGMLSNEIALDSICDSMYITNSFATLIPSRYEFEE